MIEPRTLTFEEQNILQYIMEMDEKKYWYIEKLGQWLANCPR